MKQWYVVLLLAVCFACKKRQELPAGNSPSTQGVRTAEITDSINNVRILNQRMYYDDLQRISKMERSFMNAAPITYSYQYENGLLSSITWTQDGSSSSLSIERNNQSYITKIEIVNGLLGGTIYTFAYDDGHNLIRSTLQSHTDIAPFPTPDTTTYSNFVNGRYTRSYHRINDSLETRGQHLRNSFGLSLTSSDVRYLKSGLQFTASDSVRTEFEYIPFNDLERTMYDQHEELIKQYYSPNRDVYDMVLASYFQFFLPQIVSFKGYINDIVRAQQNAAIEKRNYLNLPAQVLITDPGETRDYPYVPRPVSKTRRSIRYEVD